MHAILIDPEKKELSVVKIDKENARLQFYDLMDCDVVEVGGRFRNGDILLVDENALLTRDKSYFFNFAGGEFFGKAILLNEDAFEGMRAPRTSLYDICSNLDFPC